MNKNSIEENPDYYLKRVKIYGGVLLIISAACWAFFSLFNTTISQAADSFYTLQVIIVFAIPFASGAFLLNGVKL